MFVRVTVERRIRGILCAARREYGRVRARTRDPPCPGPDTERERARQPSPIGLRPILYPDRVTLTRIIMPTLALFPFPSLVGDFEGFLIAKSALDRDCCIGRMDEWVGIGGRGVVVSRNLLRVGWRYPCLQLEGSSASFRFDVVGFCYSNTLSIRRFAWIL